MKDYLNWSEAKSLITCMESEGNYKFALLLFVSLHTGMRINDILKLKWNDLVKVDAICFKESRTNKQRTILITTDMEEYFLVSYRRLGNPRYEGFCFTSQKKSVYTVQRVNQILKVLSVKCQLGEMVLTTNTLRKTFGRELYNRTNGEALIYLSEYFSHPSLRFTLEYLQLDNEVKTQYLFKL